MGNLLSRIAIRSLAFSVRVASSTRWVTVAPQFVKHIVTVCFKSTVRTKFLLEWYFEHTVNYNVTRTLNEHMRLISACTIPESSQLSHIWSGYSFHLWKFLHPFMFLPLSICPRLFLHSREEKSRDHWRLKSGCVCERARERENVCFMPNEDVNDDTCQVCRIMNVTLWCVTASLCVL